MPLSEVEWFDVPMGRVPMGTDEAGAPDDERPSRLVTVRSLVVSVKPVSTELFAAFVNETGHRTIAEAEGSSFASAEVSAELIDGADWRSSLGEGGDGAVAHVSWFDAVEFCRWANMSLPTEAEWVAAAAVQPSLGGDRWQWCADWYDPVFHRDEQRVNPVGPTAGTRRVARGGSPRITERRGLMPDHSAPNLTFRIIAN